MAGKGRAACNRFIKIVLCKEWIHADHHMGVIKTAKAERPDRAPPIPEQIEKQFYANPIRTAFIDCFKFCCLHTDGGGGGLFYKC